MKFGNLLFLPMILTGVISASPSRPALGAPEEEALGDLEGSDAELPDDLPKWAVGADLGVTFNHSKASMGFGPSALYGIDPDTAALFSYQDQTAETKNKSRSSSYSSTGGTSAVVKSWDSETNVSGVFKFGVRRMVLGPLFFDFSMAFRKVTSVYQFDYEKSTGDGMYQAMGFWLGVGPGVQIRSGNVVTTVKVADLLAPVFRYKMIESFNRGDANAASPSGIFESESQDNAKSALSEVMFQVLSVGVAYGAK